MEVEAHKKEKVLIPAIVSDIDGVLILGPTPIAEGTHAINILQKSLGEIDPTTFGASDQMRIPFMLLTNGGGKTEDAFVDKINRIHSFEAAANSSKIRKEQLILNYTPLKQIIKEQSASSIILVCGSNDPEVIAEYAGAKLYITVNEYLKIYPFISPMKFKKTDFCQATLQRVAKRLGVSAESIKQNHIQISAVFILYDPLVWEESIQVITDLLTTSDGTISESSDLDHFENHIPVYCVSDDVTYKDRFRLPRIVFGSFNRSLNAVYKALYKRDLELTLYGKPSKHTFAYTEQACRDLLRTYNEASPDKEYAISNFYMIGDNPASDIQGANLAGWKSVLVRTGVFRNGDNSEQYPAKIVCDNVLDAIRIIFKQENINFPE